MSAPLLSKQISEELKVALERGLADGSLMTPERIDKHLAVFRERFGPEVLANRDGEELLQLMHGRQRPESKCLMYWLEFKNDDEFAGQAFGRIGGAAAFIFGLFQREKDGAWVSGNPANPKVISTDDAIAKARQQRDELLAGHRVLAAFNSSDTSDGAYSRLQSAMTGAAPGLSGIGWAHKYWFLLHANRLDDYHSPRYQRFYLFKLLQMPPDRLAVKDAESRFLCAGRFISAARELGVPVTTLTAVLSRRNPFHRYWRIGTTALESESAEWESRWAEMRDGGWVSIGWKTLVPDLSGVIGQTDAKDRIRKMLLPLYEDPGTATRKAGEILNFTRAIAENDLVLACDGQDVLGVGRVHGPYEYDSGQEFPHKRPVEWLSLDCWKMPEKEGLRTTVWEIGGSAENLLEVEQRLYAQKAAPQPPVSRTRVLLELDGIAGRVENILRRKRQVILYGRPERGRPITRGGWLTSSPRGRRLESRLRTSRTMRRLQ